MKKVKVLSTKKLSPGLLQRGADHGIALVEQEFISIEPVWNRLAQERLAALAEKGRGTIAVTSPNTASILDQYHHVKDTFYVIRWKCYCIAGKTKETLLNVRNMDVDIAGEAWNGADLADIIIRNGEQHVLFFCGDIRRDELPQKLKAAGVEVEEFILYKTIATPVKVEEDLDAVMFYSPSGVQSFFSANELPPQTVCFSIGRTTGTSIASFTSNTIITSAAPDAGQLVEEVIKYFQNR